MINFKTIKLVIWDLDETLWEGTLSDNDAIKLRNEFVRFINDSLDRGIVHSICSKNDFESTMQQLKSFDIWDLFVFPSIDWTPKASRIKSIIHQMKLRDENVLFIDDNTSNLNEALYYCSQLQTCTPEKFLSEIDAIYELNNVDLTRPRLTQYRLLEEKTNVEKSFSSNTDFLMSCNIRVTFHNDCIENIDRIHDLIMRSNQLNYTKFRQTKDELLADLSYENTESAYIMVSDSFGDYGIVGFYMIVDKKVKHYLFSCRTLGMLVEQYAYIKIGCPEINVVGDVITQLNKTDIPEWINQKKNVDDNHFVTASVGQKILFKGPCDISQIFSFIEQTKNVTTEFTYVNDCGITVEGYNHTSQIVTALKCNPEQKAKLLNDTAWIDEKAFNADSWQSNDAIIFSVLTDGNLGIYRHKETGYQISLCEKHYDLTDTKTWEDYINNKIFTSNINFKKDELVSFAKNFEYVDNSQGDITVSNLDILYNSKKSDAILILFLGSEKPFINNKKPSYVNRHLFHQILNTKIKAWAANKTDVYLIEIGNYINSQKDYTDTINHFQKRIYYHLAQDVLGILNNNQAQVEIKDKRYLYLTIAKHKIKYLIKKLLKKL